VRGLGARPVAAHIHKGGATTSGGAVGRRASVSA
jgi:hypothetical protein